ncbi:MAG: alginate export family protein [Acidobacteriota bacterium]|jgi:hypothetical protein
MRYLKTFFVMVVLSTGAALTAVGPAAEGGTGGGKLDWWVDGQAWFRGEWRYDLDLDEAEDDNTFYVASRLRVGFGVRIQQDYAFYFQAQDARLFGDEAATAANDQNLDLHQGYVDIWRQRERGWSLRVGRQEWVYGKQRILGNLDWVNTGRSFDGVQVRYQGDRFRVDVLGALIRSQFTPVGGSVRTDNATLAGVYASGECRPGATSEGYWLNFTDRVPRPGEIAGTTGTTDIHAFGYRTTQTFGRVDLEFEGVYETGDVTGDDLSAWAAALVVGYTFGDERKIRPFAGYDFATGDRDSTDGKREEFFNFFPTNHMHYGYADLFGWRNIRSYYFGSQFGEGKHWGQAKIHRFSLETPGGAWKNAAGIVLGFDPTGGAGRSVGWELDLNYRYAFMKNAKVEAGVSWFEPGHFARTTRGPDPTQWGYLWFVIGF